jgi:3D (Asp-Asp-Asp) domain-containing protein
VLELYALETKLDAARARIARLANESAAVRRERVTVQTRLVLARRTMAAAQAGLAERVRALYEEGEIDPLSVILGAESFDDALTRLDHANRVADQDREIARTAAQARGRFARLARALAARQAELERLQHEAEAAAASLDAARAERSSYIDQLAAERRLNESQIGSLEEQAQAAEEQARTAAEQSAAAAAAAAESTPSVAAATSSAPAAGQMTVVATAYALRGTTATGIAVGPGVVAVDPSVIPLGTRMTIPGYGEGVAADTGGAIIGARIDVWVPTEAEAEAWGVRTVTITVH